MLINEQQFKKVRVQTQGGQDLGFLAGFDLDTDTGKIAKYHVKSKNIITGLLANRLIIDKEQVISFDQQKMIVEDTAVTEETKVKAAVKQVEEIKGTEPVITSKKA
ncbi:hypothetical protein ACFL2U_03580 [Patescibacteria group bacterium]